MRETVWVGKRERKKRTLGGTRRKYDTIFKIIVQK
jgi:hypothetical protein